MANDVTVEEWNIGVDNAGFLIKGIWPEIPDLTISEYAAQRRNLPLGTPFPGPWSNERTPYLVEMMDDMGPRSPIQEEYCLKGHQIGFTAAAENILLYWMDLNPTEILFVSATQESLKDWATKRLEPAIDSVGMRIKLTARKENTKSRRTGDVTFSKEFIGGSLRMVSAQAAAGLRSMSKRVLIMDEMDGAPAELKTGEGIFCDVAAARTTAFGNRKKILGFSTPTTIDESLIYRKYLDGDCRKYLVPCPFCGKFQELVMMPMGGNFGLTAETKAGEFVRAIYICEFCRRPIEEYHKLKMLAGGHWEATKKSKNAYYRSRHISSLYSPPGMCSWEEILDKQKEAIEDSDAMRTFQTLYLGLPYAETGARPDLRKVIALRGTYAQKEVQPGVIYLTAAIDVQRGKQKAETPAQGPRLEMEVLGHGRGYRTWSIDYQVFTGEVTDPFAGAWEALNDWAVKGGLLYKRSDGPQFSPAMILVDSSNGEDMPVVYSFCGRWRSTHPCKGAKTIVADPERREKGDIAGTAYKRYRTLAIDANLMLWEINTQFYKAQLYNKLGTVMRRPADPQPNGFQDFPRTYPDEYFAQLTAEEQLADGSFKTIRERNESLDCRVYNMAAGDIYLMAIVEQLRAAFRAQGVANRELEGIGSKQALDQLESKIPGGCRIPGCPYCGKAQK